MLGYSSQHGTAVRAGGRTDKGPGATSGRLEHPRRCSSIPHFGLVAHLARVGCSLHRVKLRLFPVQILAVEFLVTPHEPSARLLLAWADPELDRHLGRATPRNFGSLHGSETTCAFVSSLG